MIHSRFRETKGLKIVATGTGCLLAMTAVFACVSTPSAAQTGAQPVTSLVAAQVDDEATSAEQHSPRDLASAPQVPARARPSAGEESDPLLTRGRELFAKQCSICHGETGDGLGKFAYLMNPRPRNFQQGDFKLSATQNQIPTEEDLLRTISRGMPGSAMPPWGHLPQSDLIALARYVRQINVDAVWTRLEARSAAGRLSKGNVPAELARRTEPGPPLLVPPEPAFDDLRWYRGRRIYLEACAPCHGADGNPVPEAVKFDNEGYPVPPRSFVNGIFKGGSEGHQLYARIFKGMKGTPMPGYEGAYTDAETWDLIHYVQSLARAGAQERAQLKQGTFVAARVRCPLPAGPMDATWDQARPLYVALTPLWWTEERIEGLVVQALHNDEELAIRLSWIDPTVDERAVRTDEFRDGVAIQFSLTSDPPFYMGDSSDHGGVYIWYWKADRQKDLETAYQDVDAAFPDRVADMYPEQDRAASSDEVGVPWPYEDVTKHDRTFITAWGAGNLVANPELKTPVETLTARGPGTLASKPANIQLVEGQAVYERGVWYVQMQRSMKADHPDSQDERRFQPGDYLPLSFAIWNGSSGDRDGKKNISIWQKLVIE